MNDTSASTRARHIAWLFLCLAMIAWGSLYIATMVALKTIPPLTLLFLRYAVASIALAVLIAAGKKALRVRREDWLGIFLIGSVGYFLSVAVQIFGTKFAGASAASLVNAMMPIFITIFAVLFLGEKLTAGKVLATVFAISGAVVMLCGGNGGSESFGILLSVGAVVLWSFSSVVARVVTTKYDPLVVSAWGMFVAMGCSLPASAIELCLAPHGSLFTGAAVLSVAYLGLVSTALPSVLWNLGLSRVDASTCGLFYPIQPLVSVTLGIILLGETIGLKFAVGAVLIIGGVLYAILSERKAIIRS